MRASPFCGGQDLAGHSGPAEDRLMARLAQKQPYPLLRHHFGLPSFCRHRGGDRQDRPPPVFWT